MLQPQPTPLSSPHSSSPSSPLLAASPRPALPVISSLSPEAHPPQRRLLIPTVRPCRVPPRPQRTKTGKLGRQSRSASVGTEPGPNRGAGDWVSALGRLHIVEDQLELRRFQCYAVEKWVVERGRLVNVVSVYTGIPDHKITVTALEPYASLSDAHAQSEFDNAVHFLRRDGARPRETEHGVLLVTTLANFRSDYNIVRIPDGSFLAHREQLYVNINLLRMGCSGRSALTLEAPSEPTKDRYLSMYCFSESVLSGITFNDAVLDLVKLVQVALALFGMFDTSPAERNGLLCDATADGIQQWTYAVGEPLLSLEPMGRVCDPSVVSALLSLVVATRNKLSAIGLTQAPKDPFRDPAGFMHTIMALPAQKLAPPGAAASPGYLTLETIRSINAAYDRAKAEYRVPRMILNKLDDITTDLNLRRSVDASFATAQVYGTADLAGFVHAIVGAGGKDTVQSLKALWTGKPRRKKARKDGAALDDDERERTDGRSTEDDDGGASIFPNWGRHMKIDGLKAFDFALGRSKKPSVDLTAQVKARTPKPVSPDEAVSPGPLLPALVISGDSGGDGSPHSGILSSIGRSPTASARSSNVNLASPEGLHLKPMPRLTPVSLPSAFGGMAHPRTLAHTEKVAFLRRSSAYDARGAEDDEEFENERRANRGRLLGTTHRRHSMDDLLDLPDEQPQSFEEMKIDVGLCGQYLIMRRRESHLRKVATLLQQLSLSLSEKNAQLQDDLDANEGPLADVALLRHEVSTALDAAEARANDWGNIQEVLGYQAGQMEMKNLWRSVRQQRNRVLSVRQAVFGAPGARPRPGTANRRFFRVQTTLDPQAQRLVDWFGRTESEAEEELGIPEWAGGVWVPPYEELRAYAEATRAETPSAGRWWWPFGRGGGPEKGSDDETAAASGTVQAEAL